MPQKRVFTVSLIKKTKSRIFDKINLFDYLLYNVLTQHFLNGMFCIEWIKQIQVF